MASHFTTACVSVNAAHITLDCKGAEMNDTLFDMIFEQFDFQARKHGLGEDYAENAINKMTNTELLRAISNAFENIREPK